MIIMSYLLLHKPDVSESRQSLYVLEIMIQPLAYLTHV